MFGIGSTELVIIIVVALVVIGPQKLPEMMRTLGKGLAEFKRVGQDVKETLDNEVKQAEDEIKKQEQEVKEAAKSAAREKAEAVLENGGKSETEDAAKEDGSMASKNESDASPATSASVDGETAKGGGAA
ncbi:sec-independent protein translocase protein TatB [Paucidesulfovibrio gracilis DSM 16080]|uniref:Multifunctional fusion protein n=1 Tax=Paucidesulfovibrio gracilis DSM 16080 TaxID=1121449 RepID=A0A1T4W1A4_9BACT|nr:Sec-independent protein translocase protein TatB [Paucidesulfovibrio gracilis]SKA70845.1 sec-independent protein translocase protein TatB [Paucidesulfovibrio gracilis DSM 16080]